MTNYSQYITYTHNLPPSSKNDIIQEVAINDYMGMIFNVDSITFQNNRNDILALVKSIQLIDKK